MSIFPNNINITAIVGENGSGKSSILQEIRYGKTFFNTKDNEVDDLKKEDYKIIHINYDFLKINLPSWKNYMGKDLENENSYKKNQLIRDKTKFDISRFSKFVCNNIFKYLYLFKSETFFYKPLKIIFFDNFHPKKENCEKLTKEVKDKNFSKEKFLTFLYIKLFDVENLEIHEIESNILSIEKEIIEKSNLKNIENIYTLLTKIEKSTILIEDFKDIYNEYKESFLELINIEYLKINFIDKEDREYSDLSQGERKLFTEMLMIFDEIKKSENNNFLLLLDEPDLTLHPNWQKRYIKEMIKLLSTLPEKKFHLIVTSHSPFILSDLPKENVIFLEKGKQVNPDIEQTFGANIHTLLSHGFFMDGGLMGEFAKEKINEVIKLLNPNSKRKLSKKNQKFCKHIISIIGEPILQKTLEHQLNEKLNPNETELQKLEREQKEIEDKIKKLKGNQ